MLTVAKSLPYFILCICLVGFSFGGLLVVFAPLSKTCSAPGSITGIMA